MPALVTIFIFGVFLSNAKVLLPNFLRQYLRLHQTEKSLHDFHILTAESTFIVRTFFFLFFGFSAVIGDFISVEPFIYGLSILATMLLIRYLYLSVSNLSFKPVGLLYLSPRGLISILLFLQIKELNFINSRSIAIDERVLLVVILSSMIILIFGTMRKTNVEEIPVENDLDSGIVEDA